MSRSSFVEVTNISGGSVSLPGFGILRIGKTAKVHRDLLETHDYQNFLDKKTIVKGGAKEAERAIAKIEKEKAEEKAKADRLKSARTAKKGKTIRKVGRSDDDDDSFIENGVEPGEDDGITFVDVEEKDRRIASHPVLSKRTR